MPPLLFGHWEMSADMVPIMTLCTDGQKALTRQGQCNMRAVVLIPQPRILFVPCMPELTMMLKTMQCLNIRLKNGSVYQAKPARLSCANMPMRWGIAWVILMITGKLLKNTLACRVDLFGTGLTKGYLK